MAANAHTTASVGTGGAIPPDFWPAMGKALAARKWPTLPVSDFPLSVVNKKFSPHSWLCCFIDGQQKSIDGAMGELRAVTHPLEYPAYRLLVAVYQAVTQAEIDALLVKHIGHRSDTPQVLAAAIHYPSGKFYPPHWPATGYHEPEYDRPLSNVLQAALTEALGPHNA